MRDECADTRFKIFVGCTGVGIPAFEGSYIRKIGFNLILQVFGRGDVICSSKTSEFPQRDCNRALTSPRWAFGNDELVPAVYRSDYVEYYFTLLWSIGFQREAAVDRSFINCVNWDDLRHG